MHIIPTQDEVVAVLRETGALRDGHFEYPSGLHSNEYLQVPLAMRYYQHQRMLSVGLSRLLRANPEIRAIIPELSIVVPMTGGLPVAYGVTEALQSGPWLIRSGRTRAAPPRRGTGSTPSWVWQSSRHSFPSPPWCCGSRRAARDSPEPRWASSR